jgi:hypothetical protein
MTSHRLSKPLIRSLALAASLILLSACDDSTSSQSGQTNEEQAEIRKYNAYVEVANSVHRSYAEDLSTYQTAVKPVLDGKKKEDNLLFPSSSPMSRVEENLDKARAMKPDMAELDGPAKAYSDALAKAVPLDRDMANYIEAKTYLSDNGAHGRDTQPGYIAAMEELATAQASYNNAIDAKDRARIKSAFDNTEKDTLTYFRIGMVYHIKDSMDFTSGFLSGTGLGDKKEAFKASLDQFNTMATGYDDKIREQSNEGCSPIMSKANAYLSSGRQIISRTEDGSYEKDRQQRSQFQMMQSREKQDANSLLQDYNNMISRLNMNQC